jgi:hypothetical protein
MGPASALADVLTRHAAIIKKPSNYFYTTLTSQVNNGNPFMK